jgi:hypothetical protein
VQHGLDAEVGDGGVGDHRRRRFRVAGRVSRRMPVVNVAKLLSSSSFWLVRYRRYLCVKTEITQRTGSLNNLGRH